MNLLTFEDEWGRFPISPSTMIVAGCPEALRNKKNGVPQNSLPSELAQFGTDAHAMFDEINKYRAPMNDLILDEILTNCGTADFENLRRIALRYIRGFPLHRIIATELKLALDYNWDPVDFFDPLACYRGVIDVVSASDDPRHIDIVDHKTGFATFDPNTPQLRFYAWMIERHYPGRFTSIGLAINFMRYGMVRYSDRHVYDFVNLGRAISAQAEKIWRTPKDAPACAGQQCVFCNWPNTCSLVQSGEVPRITNLETAQLMAAEAMALETRLRDMKSKLRIWSRDHGTIPVGNTWEYSYQETVDYKFDTDDIFDKMEDYPSLKDVLQVSSKRKQAILDHPANIRYKESVKTQFKGRKVI